MRGRAAVPGGLKNKSRCSLPAWWRKTRENFARSGRTLLYDPQTSGGLLIPLAEEDAAELVRSLEGARRIGRVIPREGKPIHSYERKSNHLSRMDVDSAAEARELIGKLGNRISSL
jgi:hypothetical protein